MLCGLRAAALGWCGLLCLVCLRVCGGFLLWLLIDFIWC